MKQKQNVELMIEFKILCTRFEDNILEIKNDLKEIKDNLKYISVETTENTKFRHLSIGGLKILGILFGGSMLVFILTKIIGGT